MKPIIFSTPMVQAILDGKKTQTRRVVNPQPDRFFEVCDTPGNYHLYDVEWGLGRIYPKYQVGDILWVRETFCEVPYEHNHVPIKGGHITIPKYAYKADSERDYTGIWKPSIHMPREAARIFLRVKEVSVERLIDISDSDVVNEGFQTKNDFFALWDKLNYHRGFGVANNPFVWKIEFERVIRQNGGQD